MAVLDRRSFLASSAATASTFAGFAALHRLALSSELAAAPLSRSRLIAGLGQGGYGPLEAAGNELALPKDFSYRLLGAEGAIMSDGYPTPTWHDGMCALPLPNGNVRLIRNHEVRNRPSRRAVIGDPATAYDPLGGGGTTSLEVDPRTREVVRDFVSLNGTIVNCAGGPTPWGSWITCEETVFGSAVGFTREHGYVFDVPAAAEDPVKPVPLKAMGRFVHEAIAVDPGTGIVYLTEDQNQSGFYRFIPERPYGPNRPGDLTAGGRLQMLAIDGQPGYHSGEGQTAGQVLAVTWVDIPNPDPTEAGSNPAAVFAQGRERGGASHRRLEGCWYGNGSIYFNATSGGDRRLGQIWQYRPEGGDAGTLTLLFESESREMLGSPDNVCVSPRGGIVLCEDGRAPIFVRGLTPDGRIFDFAKNLINNREFAGATFGPDGETLFLNIQGSDREPSMTFAIWGPWKRGAL